MEQYYAFRRSSLRFLFLTGCIKKRFGVTSSLLLYVSLSLPCLCGLCRLQYAQHIHSVALLVQYLSAVILTCINLSFPGCICSNAASLKLLALLIPLKPHRLPLAYSHDGSAVVFIVCGLIFSKAPRAPINTPNPLHVHAHTHRERVISLGFSKCIFRPCSFSFQASA